MRNRLFNYTRSPRGGRLRLEEGTPEQVLRARDGAHHMDALGFGPAQLDRIGYGKLGQQAVRGREQQLIDYYGGALSDPQRRPGALSANAIRGVSAVNPMGIIYHQEANLSFGNLAPYTGIYK